MPPGEVAPRGWRLSLIWSLSSGHPAQAEWQVPEQGVEEEVRDTLRQRAAHLPPQPARESGRPALGAAGAEGQGQRVAAWLRDLREFKWTLPELSKDLAWGAWELPSPKAAGPGPALTLRL